MVAARQTAQESAQPKKYYNRTAVPRLHVVPNQDVSERIDRQEQKTAQKKLASIAQTGALVFACILIGAVSVAGYERLTSVSLQVDKVKKEIAKVEKRIDTLDVQIACVTDITNVMDVAVSRFGMDYPQKEQIVELEGGSAVDAPTREASLPYADVPIDDDGGYEAAAWETSEADPAGSVSDESPELNDPSLSGVPAYAAVATRIEEEELPIASSTSKLLLAQPQ